MEAERSRNSMVKNVCNGVQIEVSSIPATLRLAVVGAGALGSELCRLLATQGHQRVIVVDPDVLEPRNVSLSLLFQQAVTRGPGLGRSKAALVVEHARPLPWQSFQCEIADLGLDILRSVDVLLSCTDSTLSRLETTLAARMLGLPLLDGGLKSQGVPQGRVTWFDPAPSAGCSLCRLPEYRRAEILSYALSASLGCTAPPDFPSMSGTLPVAAAVAQAMLHLLAEQSGASGHTSFARILDLAAQSSETIALPLGADCPWHSFMEPSSLARLVPGETFGQAMLRLQGSALDLPWPVCTRARCLACLAESAPMRRTAYTRRRAVCPHCSAAGTLEPLQTLETIFAGHPLAACTPASFGLTDDELYQPRSLLQVGTAWEPHERQAYREVRP